MSTNLLAIQKEFIEKLFQYKAVPGGIASPYAIERFNVYRQSIYENCRRALELTFPYVWKAFSEKNISANNIVGVFLKDIDHWPTSGCLDDWGDKFPHFLLTISEGSTELRDLAQYEWLCNKANFLPEMPAFSAADLTSLSEVEQTNLTFCFQPSFALHYTTFPLGKFIKELPLESEYWVIIMRSNSQILTYKLSTAWALFFKLLQENHTLTTAYEIIVSSYPDFDLTAALAFLLEKKLCQI